MFDFKDERYNRQIAMPEWGPDRQARLASARVAVIGAGGVKSSLLMALVAAGIGHIRLVEFDHVDLSNLNRQVLYRTSDIGQQKGIRAQATLQDLNPEVDIELVNEKLTSSNIEALLGGYQFIVEGGDSPAGRNLVNTFSLGAQIPFVHASAQFSYGYVFSVVPEEQTACFACFFPRDYTREEHTGPVPVNVLSTLVAGTLGAAEVLRWCLGYRDRMTTNRRVCFSSLLLSSEFTTEFQPRRLDCPVCSKFYR